MGALSRLTHWFRGRSTRSARDGSTRREAEVYEPRDVASQRSKREADVRRSGGSPGNISGSGYF